MFAKNREEWIESKLPTVVSKATGHFHIEKLQNSSTDKNFNAVETQLLLNKVRTAINEGVLGL